MKSKLALLSVISALSLPVFAASYTFSAGASTNANGIRDATGNAFRGGTTAGAAFATGGGTSAGPGVVAVGIFSTDALSELSASNLVAAFTIFGANPPAAFSSGGSGGNRGIFSLPAAGVVTGSNFANKNMYLFAGNGTTFGNSTEFFVLKSSSQFLAAADEIPTAVDTFLGFTGGVTPLPANQNGTLAGTILFGTQVANWNTASTDATTTPGFQMAVAVPEPAVTLLSAFGILGLLRRRRN